MSEAIKGAIIGAIITGILGIVGTIMAANMGKDQGEQETINQLNSQIANVNGDNNTVTINSVDDLINEYSELTTENKSLVSQNTKYYDELEEAKSKIEEYESQSNSKVQELEQQLNNMPIVQFKDIGLSIDGNDIPINKNNSMATIDGREYVSKELAEKLLASDKNILIKDNTLYIGKIVTEKANLFDKHINSTYRCSMYEAQTDSYGNKRSNVLYFNDSTVHNIVFVLDKNYNYLKFTISVSDNASSDRTGVITVKADDEVVYTSDNINKQTAPFEVEDIAINSCTLLTIEYNSDYSNQCIVSDAIVYN